MQQTVNLSAKRLRRFESSPPHHSTRPLLLWPQSSALSERRESKGLARGEPAFAQVSREGCHAGAREGVGGRHASYGLASPAPKSGNGAGGQDRGQLAGVTQW